MKALVALILMLMTIIANGQGNNSLILTKEENDNWLKTIKKLDSKGKFEFLRARILADTNVYLPVTHPDKSIEKGSYAGKTEGVSKPKLVINDMQINLNDLTKSDEIVILWSLLTERNFKRMRILDAQMVSTLSGIGYFSGIFHLKTKDKEVERRIRSIGLD